MNGLCMLCKELITNPISIDTISKHISLWLPPELVDSFKHLNDTVEKHITSYYRVTESENPKEQLLCVHCYVKEIHQWLEKADPDRAGRFLDAFSFGYSRSSYTQEEAFEPQDTQSNTHLFGLCDECGEYADELSSATGEWLCEDCAHYG